MTTYNFYSAAGGQGCTTAACAFALSNERPTLLIDMVGDVRAVLGLAESYEPTVVNDTLTVANKDSQFNLDAYEDIVFDHGRNPASVTDGVKILVTKHCYIALRRGLSLHVKPHTVVVLSENGRALRDIDVECCLGVKIAAVMKYDPTVSRSIDAGLMSTRLPRPLTRFNNDIRLHLVDRLFA
jgi:hypothetical protein